MSEFYNDMGENPLILRHQFSKMNLADTSEGAAWAIKCLHPCDESTLLYSGIPDKTAASVITPEHRTRESITPPVPTGQAVSWDCAILGLPFPDTPAVYFRRLNTDPAGQWDQGVALTNPLTTDFRSTIMKYRLAYSGTTAHLVASATTDMGMVKAASVPLEFSIVPETAPTTGERVRIADGQQWDITAFDQVSPKIYTSEARGGTYVVDRLCEDTCRFVPNGVINVDVYAPSQNSATGPVPDATPKGISVAGSATSNIQNFTNALILFTGLSPQASIDLKCVRGYEACPQTKSILSTMLKCSPDYDPRALSMASRVAQRMPAAFPAHYNDLGDIFGGISRAIASLGIPVVSDIAGAVGHLVNPAHYANPMSAGEVLGSVAQSAAPLVQRLIRR